MEPLHALQQMIMGLPSSEREELLANVAERVAMADDGDEVRGVATPRELYDFQLTGTAGPSADVEGCGLAPPMLRTDAEGPMDMKDKKNMKNEKEKNAMDGGDNKMTMKLKEKLEKYRGKVAKNQHKLARAEYMLSAAETLIAQGKDAQVCAHARDCTQHTPSDTQSRKATQLRMLGAC